MNHKNVVEAASSCLIVCNESNSKTGESLFNH